MNKRALPWLVGGAALIGAALYFNKKASAAVTFKPLPAPKPSPKAPKAPPAPSPSPSPAPSPSPKPTAPDNRVAPFVPGYDPITVPCDDNGDLGVYDSIQVKRLIDASTDPDYLQKVAASLYAAHPSCSVLAAYAERRAAALREAAKYPTEPPMGGLP